MIQIGQYYIPVILDEKGTVTAAMLSHEYGDGLKLMEHSWLGNSFVESFETLLALDGARRVVWAGDYADDEPGQPEGGNLYTLAMPYDEKYETEDTSKLVRIDHPYYLESDRWGSREGTVRPPPNLSVPFVVTAESHPFVVNHDKKEFVDKGKVPGAEQFGQVWKIHPLPLLTCEGNGRGGGDFRGNESGQLVGRWSRDRISVGSTVPTDYTEIVFDLGES